MPIPTKKITIYQIIQEHKQKLSLVLSQSNSSYDLSSDDDDDDHDKKKILSDFIDLLLQAKVGYV